MCFSFNSYSESKLILNPSFFIRVIGDSEVHMSAFSNVLAYIAWKHIACEPKRRLEEIYIIINDKEWDEWLAIKR